MSRTFKYSFDIKLYITVENLIWKATVDIFSYFIFSEQLLRLYFS